MKKLLILTLLFLSSCTLNKVVQHHGVHSLEKKQTKLKVNTTNKNEIIKFIGPPSTKSTSKSKLADEVRELKKLYKEGTLSKQEFTKAKNKLIK